MFNVNLPYSFLTTLPPSAFLHPRMFKTDYDTPEKDQEQYAKGLEIGQDAEYVTIGKKGMWRAKHKMGGLTASYEGIGYHASTAALLKGFLDSDTEVYVDRYDTGSTRIK